MPSPNVAKDIALLRQVPFFATLSEADMERLARPLRRRTFRANDTLFFTGDPGHTLYIIVSGSVKICRNSPDGDRIVIALLGAGTVFGEMSLLDGQPRSADAVVAEPTETLMLNREDFQAVLRENVGVALELLAVLADRLRRTNDNVNGPAPHAPASRGSLQAPHGFDRPDANRANARQHQASAALPHAA